VAANLPKPKTPEEEIGELRALVDTLASSLATVKGNQGQLTVAVNRLQSEKLSTDGDKAGQSSHNLVSTVACHGHKLLFSTYNGTEDPLPWLNWCVQFFCIQATEDVGKVFLASFYMTNDAAQWFAHLEKSRSTPTWMEFEQLVHQRFGPPLRGIAVDEPIQLQHDSTVADYQNKFLQLVNQCANLSEKHQIGIFTAGLRNPLKIDIELKQLATLEEVMALARTYEQRLSMTDETPSRTPTRPAYSRLMTKTLALPAPVAVSGGSTSTTAAPLPAPRLKLLTATKMAAKREKGECYNCTEQFSREHLKVCPMKDVFLLEMDALEHTSWTTRRP
jgi:hypothetical protein